MGSFLTKLIDKLAFNKTKSTKLLLLGLDGAGKTTLIYRLKLNEFMSTIPTIGFNVETIKYKNLNMTMWDIGGQKSIRQLWRHYFPGTDAIIFVIDSCDKERLELAKEELYGMFQEDELRDASFLIFCNKQDMAIMSVDEIMNKLDLHMVKKNWKIQGCSAATGQGITEGMEWLCEQVEKKKK